MFVDLHARADLAGWAKELEPLRRLMSTAGVRNG